VIHTVKRFQSIALRPGSVLLLLFLALSPLAQGATSAFSAIVNGESREFVVELYDAEGMSYVSLRDLASHTGGACIVSPAQVAIDLPGFSALIGMNSNEVTASRESFTLQHPVLPYENDALIAESDVNVFFSRAFGMDVLPRQPDGSLQQGAGVEIAPAAEADLLGGPIAAPSTPAATGAPRRPSSMNPIQKVIIDPGHGGEDHGVSGPSGAAEKEITLAVARQLAQLLPQIAGVEVHLTRDGDTGLSVNDRINIANQQKGDLLISLHTAASPVTTTYGLEIFSPLRIGGGGQQARGGDFGPMNRYIAEIVGQAIASSTDAEIRAPREAPLKVLSDVNMPALLIELGFVTNPAEESLLITESYQTRLARGIAEGIHQVVQAYENR